MSYSYPLALPSTPGFTRSHFMLNDLIGVSESPFDFGQQIFDWNAQRWEVELSLPQMLRADAEAWITTFLKLRGRKGTFLLGDPDAKTARGLATGTPTVSGAHSAGALSLATTGWTASKTNILKAGDYLQIGSGTATRLYKNLSDADSDGSGNATLDILPALREALSGSESITVSDCKGTFRLSAPVPWDSDFVSRYGITFSCVEAL